MALLWYLEMVGNYVDDVLDLIKDDQMISQ